MCADSVAPVDVLCRACGSKWVRKSPRARTAERASPGEALLVSACRAVDSAAYKHGAMDLSGRLIELMRWAAPRAEDALLDCTVAYVRTEVHFAASAHTALLRQGARGIIDGIPH